MIIRYLASPSVYSFSHFGSSTLCLQHRVMHTHTCTHHTFVFDFALDIQRLCILGSGIPYKLNLYSSLASPLILKRLAFSSLASPTNRVNRRISYTWLSPSIPGPQWHVRGGGFGLASLVRKKSAMVTRNIGAHGFCPLIVKALVVRHSVQW